MCEDMPFSLFFLPLAGVGQSDFSGMGSGLARSLSISLSLYPHPLSHPEAGQLWGNVLARDGRELVAVGSG